MWGLQMNLHACKGTFVLVNGYHGYHLKAHNVPSKIHFESCKSDVAIKSYAKPYYNFSFLRVPATRRKLKFGGAIPGKSFELCGWQLGNWPFVLFSQGLGQ